MFGIGMPELILIMIVGLIVLGPSKLPEAGRSLAKGLQEFRKASSAFTNILNAPPEPPRPAAPPAPAANAAPVATQRAEKAAAQGAESTKAEPEAKAESRAAEQESAPAPTPAPKGLAEGYAPPSQDSAKAAVEAHQKSLEKTSSENM